MTVFTIHPVKWSSLAILLVVGYVIDECAVFALEGEGDLQQQQQQPSNRVLPVDAEHKSKISIPQLHPVCVQNLKENLVKFLKRVKKDGGVRKGRQDDGDDDGDGDEGLAGVLAGLGEGNGALSVLQAFPAAVPSLVQGFTQLTGSINQGLNGTDTPNLPSFLVKQGMEAIKFFQSISGGGSASRLPPASHAQRVPSGPGSGGKPRPPSPGYEQYPGSPSSGGSNLEIDPDDYLDEDVKQPLQPTLRPLRPGYGGNDGGLGIRPDYEPIPGGNPFKEKKPGNIETINGLPPKTSLWQIYKSFRNKSPENGTLSEFQLAHPDAFSNELLQSISQSISSVRGQTANQAVPTNKPPSEIFKQIYPENKNPPVVFNNPNRPTLSVYKPSATSGGIGIDLSNLALNASLNALEGHKQTSASSSDEEDTTQSQSIQGEIEDSSILGLGDKDKIEQKATAVNKETTQNTGTFAQLQQQAQMQMQEIKASSGGPQFVKSPTSSLLTLPMGEYIPAVSSLHEGDDDLKVGPQTNHEDYFNGIRNKAPYQAEKGVFIAAPRLTPSPLYTPKPTPGLFINEAIETTTLTPDFSYEFLASNSRLGPNSNYPPDAAHARPKDPNAPRPPTLIAAIAPNFPSIENALPQNQNNKLDTDRLPSSLLPQVSHVPASDVAPKVESTTMEATYEVEEVEPETTTPEPPPTSVEEDLAPPEQNIKQTASGTGSLKTSVLASSLSNFAQLSAINQNEQNVDEAPSSEPPPVSVTQSAGNHNSKLFQHLLGSLNLPQLLQHPAVLQSLFASQNNGNPSLNATKASSTPTLSTSPEPEPTVPEEEVQEDIVTSTFATTIQEELPNPPEQNTNSIQNQYQLPGAPYLLGGNKGGSAFPSFIAQSHVPPQSQSIQSSQSSQPAIQPPSQSISGAFEFSNVFQSPGSNSLSTNAPPSDNIIPPFRHQLNQNTRPFQFEHIYSSSSNVRNDTIDKSASTGTSTTPAPLSLTNQGSYVDNSFYAGINFAPPPRFPNPGPIEPLVATSTEPALPLNSGNTWGIQLENNNKDSYGSAPFIANYPAIAAASNSKNRQPDLATLPPFSGPIGFVPGHKDENDDKSPNPTSSTLFSEPSSTTEREINLSELSLGFQPSFPASIPSAPLSVASSSSGSSNSHVSSILPPLNSQNSPVFQGTFQNHGYPNYVPITSSDIHKNQFVFGGAFSSPTENVKDNSETFTTEESSTSTSINSASPSTSVSLAGSSFGEKLSSQHIGTSAIAEMSKLPFFQEDSFRPSALPPYFIGHGTGKEDQDSYEQAEQETEKSISQLFSSLSNTSGATEVISTNSSVSNISTSTVKTESWTGIVENDSVEQPYPDFPPGKPVFWMNMYYPNGIPVLMKVTTTSTSTTMKPRRRRRSTTTTQATTAGTTESEYYEDDDEEGKRTKKKKKTDVDFVG